MGRLTKRVVDALEPRQVDYFEWDADMPGFGVRIWPSGQRVYLVQYRAVGRTRRVKLGTHGALTVEEARRLGKAVLGDVAKGENPAEDRATRRKSLTISELCDRYLAAADRGLILGKGGKPKKRSTLETDRGRIARHIKPLLGTKLVADIGAADVHRFVRSVSDGKTALIEKTNKPRGKTVVRGGAGTAARTTGLLGGILSFAVSEGVIPLNPARGVKRPAGNRRERRLNTNEYLQLGSALRGAELDLESPQAIAAIRLLALSGCRLSEIVDPEVE